MPTNDQAPSHPTTPTYPHNISQFHPLGEYPISSHRSPRRSRSKRHRSTSRRHDKRPVSIPRSPRRRRSTRRFRRSSRPRSSYREFSTSRHASRQPSRATSITLRSASPQRREERHHVQDHQPPRDQTHPPATLQPASWEYHPQQSSHNTNTQSPSYHYDQSSTNKWQSWGQWKDYSIPTPQTHPIHPNGLTTPNHQPATTILMTPPPSHSQHSPPTTPHLIARRRNHQTHRVLINPILLSMSLQDTLPSTFKKVPKKSGSEASSMP